jgi:uncharacterized 2Fe-2S/4Fe-4S cluster protein (DUF4445 family)
MAEYTVTFYPHALSVRVQEGTTLLEATAKCNIAINNLCGGDGICGRCKMIVRSGKIIGEGTSKLSREEIKAGYVLSCEVKIMSDLIVEIPKEIWAKEKVIANMEAQRFSYLKKGSSYAERYKIKPIVLKLYMELEKPTLANVTSDLQLISDRIREELDIPSMQTGLKIIKNISKILRKYDYKVTVTLGLRRQVAEIMYLEGGDTVDKNYMIIVDMGTSTVVAHLVNANTTETMDGKACFNSQGVYGREVTGRIIRAEKIGTEELQKLLVEDINKLIEGLCNTNQVNLQDITAVVCAGNTVMTHFLLGLSAEHIRRTPYVPVSLIPPPLRATEVGIAINPRGLLYALPCISGWVGSDLTAGILATEMHKHKKLCLLVDIGTNGEIILGNEDWLIASSASAGPALEGASVECGMRAESGAIEKVYVEDGEIKYKTIHEKPAVGICGSGIIDVISVLLNQKIINRSGRFIEGSHESIVTRKGIYHFILVDSKGDRTKKSVYISEKDIENVIVAKAAIFAAIKILLKRLELSYAEIDKVYLGGAFGNYIDIDSAINIGLIPPLPKEKIEFVGNTAIKGAKLTASYQEAFHEIAEIRTNTTYYDLMGADDYVEEFRKAMFLPHTDINDWGEN